MYRVFRPTPQETKESFGMLSWFQSIWRWILSKVQVKVVTAAYTVEWDRYYVKADATSGAFAVTLPIALEQAGRVILIKKIDVSVNAVTVTRSGSDTIDGATTYVLSSRWDAVELISDGVTSWHATSQPLKAALTSYDHGGLAGLVDDDHTQYLLANGSRGYQPIGMRVVGKSVQKHLRVTL